MHTNKKGKEIIRHDSQREYLDISIRIKEDFPNNPLAQIKEWGKQPSEFRVLGLAETLQSLASTYFNVNEPIHLSTGQIDLLFRTILDLSRHLQEHLPDGVYDYNYHNIQGVVNNITEQILELSNSKNKPVITDEAHLHFMNDKKDF